MQLTMFPLKTRLPDPEKLVAWVVSVWLRHVHVGGNPVMGWAWQPRLILDPADQ